MVGAARCSHCFHEASLADAWVQVDFPDASPFLFCGFKCLYHWARNQVDAHRFLTISRLIEPRT